MKNNYKIGLVLYLVLIVPFTSTELKAQQFDEFLRGSATDSEQLLGAYANPFLQSFGEGLSNGWYNTAKPHSTLGFDLTISMSMAFIPTSAETFTFNNVDYSTFQLADGRNSAELPTLLGPSDRGPQLMVEQNGQTVTFDSPSGTGLSDFLPFIPTPILQAGIGIIKGTEVKFRYMPSVGIDGVSVGLWGVGLVHDVKQWIPVVNKLPFDMSVIAAYSRFNTDFDFTDGGLPGSDQKAELGTSAFTGQLLLSKKLAVLTFYSGFGFNTIGTSLAMLGTYELEGTGEAVVDPIDISSSFSSARATFGARLKLGLFTIHGDYTFQEFNTLNVGLGISFR
ncbi:MAG: hypothetical protein LAT68_06830 [Cyclobacteriaceae bacterium]|nr:hypothetical protein [Cyclobacteriaceae bacterium]MCH8516027.1 hypothetical protein [Cyclobacteriaceae bacterium]